MIDPDDDHGRNNPLANQTVRGFVDAPFNSGERSRRLEEILAVIQIQNRIAQGGVLALIVAGRKPYAQETGIPEDTALEFVETEITGCGVHSNYVGSHASVKICSILDFFHPAKCFLGYNGRSLHARVLSLTNTAKKLIREISPSDIRHKMHQVVSW